MSATPTPRRRILLVAYFYPPQNIIGARRPYALAKWLHRRGHDVTVLTSVQSGRSADDAPSHVLRTRDLLTTRLNWRKEGLAAITGQSDAAWSPGPNLWGAIFIPDVQLISWMPFAVRAALRLHRRDPLDAVITTSPVESAHAVGLALSRRGVAWVADLRDGWRFEAPREEWPLRPQRRLDAALERLVVSGADDVVTVSEPLSEDLRRRYGIAVETITNGFDPEEIVNATDAAGAPAPRAPAAVDPSKLTLVHTGGLGHERTLRPILEALARLAAEDPGLRDRVELVLAGAQTTQERAMYAEPEFAPFVRHLGFIERADAMALQQAADVLLLVTSGVRTGEATGKLFEYLAAGRPILVVGAGSAAAEIVVGAGAGSAVPVRDAAAAEVALRGILAGERPPLPESARAQYAYPALTARYEQLLERAIARRR
jgi:glycosyltransferase involved in cell wall biosynthesis